MHPLPPISTRTDTLFPYTPLFRSFDASVSSTSPTQRIAALLGLFHRAPARPQHRAGQHRRQPIGRGDIRPLAAPADYPRHASLLLVGQPPQSRRDAVVGDDPPHRSEEHTSEIQSLMRISYAVYCLKKKKKH